jgi:thioredoxin 1
MSWLNKVFGVGEKKAPISISDNNFRKEVKQYRGALLVDVWGPGCAPCAQLAPVMEDLATEYNGKVKVCEMNAATAPRSAGTLGVRGTPTTVVFKDGAEIGRVVGFKPKGYWKQLIETEFEDYLSGEKVAEVVAPAADPGGPKLNNKAAKKAAKRARRQSA